MKQYLTIHLNKVTKNSKAITEGYFIVSKTLVFTVENIQFP